MGVKYGTVFNTLGTYALEALGYAVSWKAVPLSITPMNRVLLAVRR